MFARRHIFCIAVKTSIFAGKQSEDSRTLFDHNIQKKLRRECDLRSLVAGRRSKVKAEEIKMRRCFCVLVLLITYFFCLVTATLTPRAPNFQYFERPKYRYPYYDENGVGRLLYGYGDDKLYQYKTFSPLEGIH